MKAPEDKAEAATPQAEAAQQAENASVTSGAGHAEPVVDEAKRPEPTVDAVAAVPADAAQPKAAEPPAQAGDEQVETRVAVAKPVLQTIEQGKAELDANPARSSVQTRDGVLVREG